MADIELVIKIPKELYEQCKETELTEENEGFDFHIIKTVANGIPLPKGRGRLMILSEDKLKENQINLDFSCQKWISEVGLSNATVAIIEADKAESEGFCNDANTEREITLECTNPNQ